jgi:hypothetical protein
MTTILYEIHIYPIHATSCSGIKAVPYFQTILNMKSIKQMLLYKYSAKTKV